MKAIMRIVLCVAALSAFAYVVTQQSTPANAGQESKAGGKDSVGGHGGI